MSAPRIGRISPLRWKTIFWMAYSGVRHRAGRSFLTFLSITLAVAFLGYVLLGDAITKHVAAGRGGTPGAMLYGDRAPSSMPSNTPGATSSPAAAGVAAPTDSHPAIASSPSVAAEPEGPPLSWVVAISLGVCICGIASAMLMSVTERFREIATLKCLGALDSVVIRVYLLEALGQGLLGAILGSILGNLLALTVGWFTYGSTLGLHLPWLALLTTTLWCLLTGITLAVIGALYPTILAAKMAPVDAMRAKF